MKQLRENCTEGLLGLASSLIPKNVNMITFFFLWRFDLCPGQVMPLRCLTITLIGRTTLGRTFLDE
jgi:hypothetical protein